METLTWIVIAIAIFIIGRAVMADTTPIPETSVKVHKITAAPELDALLSSNESVVVDFYADWCPPCRAIAPVFSGLADAHAAKGKLAFAKVNVDHVKDVAGRYGVTAMPTFVIFRDGAPGGVRVEGFAPRQSVVLGADGRVEKIRGADRGALQAVVQALAG